MTSLSEISSKIATGEFEFSKHALNQSIVRHISLAELLEAITNAEIIEDYPEINIAQVVYF